MAVEADRGQPAEMMCKYVTKLFRSEFVGNVTLLMGGNALAQAISIGTSPVITRLFTPENFGVLALFSTSSSVLGSVSSLCYDRAILLPKEDKEALSVMAASWLILFGICALSLLGILGIRSGLVELIKNPEFAIWILIVPLGVFVQGVGRMFRYWHFRQKNFRLVAIARTSESLSGAALKIGVGFLLGAWTGGLILGSLAGMVVSGLVLLKEPVFSLWKTFRGSGCAEDLKRSLVEYKKFPLFATWNSLITYLSRGAVVFVMSSFFSASVVGYYSLGNRVLRQPIALLSDSVSNVFFQKAAHDVARGVDILGGLLKMVFGLFTVGFIPFAILGVFGQEIFSLVFGADWKTAGLYVQIMTPWLFVVFVGGPGSVIYEVVQKQNIKLILNVSKGTISIAVLVLGSIITKKPETVLLWFVGVHVFFEITSIVTSAFLANMACADNM